jgi:hypothetical protein
MKFSKQAVNQTTNALGIVVGLPQIIQAIPMLVAGDYVGGGILLLQGLGMLIGFYFVGKSSDEVTDVVKGLEAVTKVQG